tara:strand:+ start:140 stop:679 length:540 start_codon:yes stop_codon:yes gene_type:complete
MEDKYTDDKIINMISQAEEISTLNVKVTQLVQDLHSDHPLLVNLKELTSELSQKVGEFKKNVSSYKLPDRPNNGGDSEPSYVAANIRRSRVEPGPGDEPAYVPESVLESAGPLPLEELMSDAVVARKVPEKPTRRVAPPVAKRPDTKRTVTKKSRKSRARKPLSQKKSRSTRNTRRSER